MLTKASSKGIRWVALLAGVCLQICLGGVYAWSVFVPPLQDDFGWTTGATQLVFGVCIAMFTVSTIVAGRLLERLRARWVALCGALCFACGYLLAGAGDGHFMLTLLGIGFMGGVGIGFGYLSVLSTCVAWFPQHKGLVTGIAVTGFGAGAMLLAKLVPIGYATGLRLPSIFARIGWSYGGVTVLAALLLFAPPPAANATVTDRDIESHPWWEPLRTSAFWVLSLGLFLGTFAGLLVVGNLKPMGLNAGIDMPIAASAIGFLALGNAGGRLLWGWIYDRLGYRAIPVSLFCLAVTILGLLFFRGSSLGFRLTALLCGIGFGACFVLYAAQTSVVFGQRGLGRVYPLIFLFYGLSGIVGPTFGGFLFDITGHYGVPVSISVAMLVLGGLICWRKPAAVTSD